MYSAMMSNMAQNIITQQQPHQQQAVQPKSTKSFHPFSIASILGSDNTAQSSSSMPKQAIDKVEHQDTTIIVDHSMPAPLQSSTPVPHQHNHLQHFRQIHYNDNVTTPLRPQSSLSDIKSSHGPAEDINVPTQSAPPPQMERVEKWVMENCVTGNLSPESTRRDILAESFALALSGNTGCNTDTESSSTTSKPVDRNNQQLHNQHHNNGEIEETSSGYSENNTASSQEILSQDQSFTSESTSRPGSPDSLERRRVGGKKARTSFTASQLCDLETHYRTQRYISAADRIKLARKLKLSDQQVKTWYQNRRMKEKRQVQDFEHAQKFHQTGAMLAAAVATANPAAAATGLLPGGYPAVTMPTTVTMPTSLSLPQPIVSMPHHQPSTRMSPSEYYNATQMSFTQMLHDSPPSVNNRVMMTSSIRQATPLAHGPLGHISSLPIPTTGDIRAISGHYHPGAAIGHMVAPVLGHNHHSGLTPGHISAFTRVGTSVVPVSMPSQMAGQILTPGVM